MTNSGAGEPVLNISRHTSGWLKGMAILLMLAHHLFGLPSLIEPPNSYIALLPRVPLEYWIGRFGKICVAIFLLLSGYGFAMRLRGSGGIDWSYFGSKAWSFLLSYWPYFLLAFAVGAVFFQEQLPRGNLRFPTDPLGFALNALTLRNNFAFEWWFAETYLLLVLLTRPLLLTSRWPVLLWIGSTCGFVAGAAMDVAKVDPTVISFANLLIWQWPWVIGIIAATWVPGQFLRRSLSKRLATLMLPAVLIAFAVVERYAAAAMTPFTIVAAPAVVFSLVRLWGGTCNIATRTLAWLGGLTLGLWLVHPFFCYYFAQDWIFAPRYSPLVFAALLAASLAVVIPIEALRKGISR